MIATGSSIAQIFGLPLGRAIGLGRGLAHDCLPWSGALAAAIAVVYQAAVFPAMPAGERFHRQTAARACCKQSRSCIALYAVTVFMA